MRRVCVRDLQPLGNIKIFDRPANGQSLAIVLSIEIKSSRQPFLSHTFTCCYNGGFYNANFVAPVSASLNQNYFVRFFFCEAFFCLQIAF